MYQIRFYKVIMMNLIKLPLWQVKNSALMHGFPSHDFGKIRIYRVQITGVMELKTTVLLSQLPWNICGGTERWKFVNVNGSGSPKRASLRGTHFQEHEDCLRMSCGDVNERDFSWTTYQERTVDVFLRKIFSFPRRQHSIQRVTFRIGLGFYNSTFLDETIVKVWHNP